MTLLGIFPDTSSCQSHAGVIHFRYVVVTASEDIFQTYFWQPQVKHRRNFTEVKTGQDVNK